MEGPKAKGKTQRVYMVALAALYSAALHFSYKFVDSQVFAYLGLWYRPPGWKWQVAGWILALLPALWMPIKVRRPSEVAYLLLYLTIYIPTMWLPYHVLYNTPPEQIFLFTLVFAALFGSLRFSQVLPAVHIKRPQVDRPTLFILLIGATLAAMAVVVTRSNFSFSLGLGDVYDRRLASRETVETASWASYVIATLANSLAPVLVAYGLAAKRYWMIPFGIAGSLSVFMLAGHKTQIAIPIVLLLFAWLLVRYRERFGLVVAGAASGLIVLSAGAYLVLGSFTLAALTSFRMIFSRGLLTSYYYDFFSQNPYTMLSDGIGRLAFAREYDLATPRLIGQEYFANQAINANANIWASAFGDGGILAMVIVTAAIFVIFRLIDSLAANRGYLFPAMMCAIIGTQWADTALDTSILSNGVLVTLALIYFLPRAENGRQPAGQRRRFRPRWKVQES